MQIVCPRLADDVDRGATGTAQVCPVIAAVYLEFLNGILAHGKPYAPRVARGFTAVNSNAVPPSIAAIKRKSALRRLLHSEVLVVRKPCGIGHAWQQERKREVIPSIYGQVHD